MSVPNRLRHAYRHVTRLTRAVSIATVALFGPIAPIVSAEVAAVSTAPNVFAIPDPNAALAFDGSAFGHGVGLCQWGAIGRARAGQDVRSILSTYYPGTTIGPIPAGLIP